MSVKEQRSSLDRLVIREIDNCTGQVEKQYIFSNTNLEASLEQENGVSNTSTTRIDVVPSSTKSNELHLRTGHLLSSLRFSERIRSLQIYLTTLFLPTGYPHTVAPDYTPYQIYDSLQAFASSIAGLLSSRAVLQSLNLDGGSNDNDIGKGTVTGTATYATLLSIAQSTISNLTTILFASHAAPYIASEVKFYRYLADIVNDAAFVLDCMSPAIPSAYTVEIPLVMLPLLGLRDLSLTFTLPLRVMTLCLSSAFRAICGVAGGSSKAVLSAHFARNGNIGELNAKDGSQETVIGLIGMWVGGVIVSRVEGRTATWCWMLALLALHLWWNWCAVKSVRLTALNGRRACDVLYRIVDALDNGDQRMSALAKTVSVDVIGSQESIIFVRRSDELFVSGSRRKVKCRMAVSFKDFTQAMGAGIKPETGSLVFMKPGQFAHTLQKLIDHFKHEEYLIWYQVETEAILIALKKDATPRDQLKAWTHAVLLSRVVHRQKRKNSRIAVLENIEESLTWLSHNWKQVCNVLQNGGWDIAKTDLEGPVSRRIDIEVSID